MKLKFFSSAILLVLALTACAVNTVLPHTAPETVPLEAPLSIELSNAHASSRIGSISEVYLFSSPDGVPYKTARMWVTYLDSEQKTQWVEASEVKRVHYPEGLAGGKQIDITLANGEMVSTPRLEMVACPAQDVPSVNWRGCQPMTLAGKGTSYFKAGVASKPGTLVYPSSAWTNYPRMLVDMTENDALVNTRQNLSVVFLDKDQLHELQLADQREFKREQAEAKSSMTKGSANEAKPAISP